MDRLTGTDTAAQAAQPLTRKEQTGREKAGGEPPHPAAAGDVRASWRPPAGHPLPSEGFLVAGGADALSEPGSLTKEQLAAVASRKATCPFIGSAVAGGALPVRHGKERPLASIDDVVALGNTGGGDLGKVLAVFARGNHAKMPGSAGAPATVLPPGLFSLDFPGSQGSHPGHSGILQGDPTHLDTGRFSQADLDRLLGRAQNGYLKRSDVAHFIAENLHRDPDAKVFGGHATKQLLGDLGGFVGKTGPAFLRKLTRKQDAAADREVFEALTKTLGEDNLVGSSGEFGLLMAFLAHSPNSKTIGGEPAVAVADVTSMFRDHQLPAGWETWPKTEKDWLVNTTALLLEAGKAYLHGTRH